MNAEPLPTRDILCFGLIDDAMANRIIAQLLFFQGKDASEPVTLIINSPGGQVAAALAILDSMELVTTPIWTRALTQACGVALLLLAAGERGHRVALEDSYLNLSPAKYDRTSLEGSDYVKTLNLKLKEKLASMTQLTIEDADRAFDVGRDFEAEEAVALGIVDAIAER